LQRVTTTLTIDQPSRLEHVPHPGVASHAPRDAARHCRCRAGIRCRVAGEWAQINASTPTNGDSDATLSPVGQRSLA
jgi:hypothetical protein